MRLDLQSHSRGSVRPYFRIPLLIWKRWHALFQVAQIRYEQTYVLDEFYKAQMRMKRDGAWIVHHRLSHSETIVFLLFATYAEKVATFGGFFTLYSLLDVVISTWASLRILECKTRKKDPQEVTVMWNFFRVATLTHCRVSFSRLYYLYPCGRYTLFKAFC